MGTYDQPTRFNGSQNVLNLDQITVSDKRKKSTVQKCLIGFVVLLFISTVICLGLFVFFYLKYNEKDTADLNPAINVCNTPECIQTAAMMIEKMDMTFDPCEDFSQYACGSFYKEAEIPKGKVAAGTFIDLNDENQRLLRAILEDEKRSRDPDYLTKMKDHYKSCIDEVQIENVGLTSYLNSEFAVVWPTLNPQWDPSQLELNDVIAKYASEYIEPLFVCDMGVDTRNSTTNVLWLNNPTLGLAQDYYNLPRNSTVLMAYQKYLADTAIELGAEMTVAETDARDVVDLEIELSKIMLSQTEKLDLSRFYNPTTLENLGLNYTFVDIPRTCRAVFNTASVSLARDERVINLFPSYLEKLEGILTNTSPRVLQNLFGFKHALVNVGRLTKRMREIGLEFDKTYLGTTSESPRWETCVGATSLVFWKGMSKEFVKIKFSEEAKTYLETMIDNLKKEFEHILREASWMGEETKKAAFEKLMMMKRKIGYPDNDFGESHIEVKYQNYTMVPDNFYKNQLLIMKLTKIGNLRKLKEPVDKTVWQTAPHDINAYYSWTDNEIAFAAGILQPPIYSVRYSKAFNYGAIGVIIGHEITHGFDDMGSKYDKNGNLNNWWQDEDRARFNNKTQCLVDQYSAYTVQPIGVNLNGNNNKMENIADNGGIKESFRAFKRLTGNSEEEQPLPGLNLTQDQLFFLAYSQMWCQKFTPEYLKLYVAMSLHATGEYRIKGPLQNSEDFSKTYNCPKGSPMNPEKKCSVW